MEKSLTGTNRVDPSVIVDLLPLPPMDRAPPDNLEVATFAMG